ncbi:hypothetical protein E2C01_019244 [Portunus trituberculatus]|uniref:Uncharacterized protein n=1 Tax=Portunus trituberculatus TaxID=210409 RepID=A0A5B7DWQ5_PORTR|nr:hypothetical protein [Portunus trituberculatus]
MFISSRLFPRPCQGEEAGGGVVGQHAATKSAVERVRGSSPSRPPLLPYLTLLAGAVATRAARHTGSLAHFSPAHPQISPLMLHTFYQNVNNYNNEGSEYQMN